MPLSRSWRRPVCKNENEGRLWDRKTAERKQAGGQPKKKTNTEWQDCEAVVAEIRVCWLSAKWKRSDIGVKGALKEGRNGG
ncbi:hypothetical protein GWI33_001311 [Rhynchophorus ferrugineus]|uniref:Uncharacterized protein n=1 Tax=Rhynchophorus ferrugineus TaxID=354439 RepID=A0A834ILC5_RHYFE|nr:hypothetical protein GWI33_001311 [Rhynchophorus ferrugineus]